MATPLLVMQSRISFRAWHRPAICNLSGTVRYKLFRRRYKIDQDQPKRKMTVTFYKWKNDKTTFWYHATQLGTNKTRITSLSCIVYFVLIFCIQFQFMPLTVVNITLNVLRLVIPVMLISDCNSNFAYSSKHVDTRL